MRTPAYWQTRGALSTLLWPFAQLYTLGARLDRALTTPLKPPLPVISIGNVTAGGTGKTPTALALAPLLRQLGYQPHFITRGYGSTARTTTRVDAAQPWQSVGDEALLLARTAPCWTGPDRLASATAAQHAGADLVVADDALQHHRLAKTVSIMVVDGPYGFGNGLPMPAGPLREPLAQALTRTDAIILIGENAHALTFDKPVFNATLQPVGDTDWIRGARLLAFAGLGRPQKFYDTLRALGAELIATHDFPDHHPFTQAELTTLCDHAANMNAIPIATAKDAVKFPAHYQQRIRTLEIALQWSEPDAFQKWLQTALTNPI